MGNRHAREPAMMPIRTIVVRRRAALIGDAAGMGAIVLMFFAALHLPALL